jgi:hypothetical protein
MLEHYRDTSHADLPDAIAKIVRGQCAAVQAAHDRIRELDQQHCHNRSDQAAI